MSFGVYCGALWAKENIPTTIAQDMNMYPRQVILSSVEQGIEKSQTKMNIRETKKMVKTATPTPKMWLGGVCTVLSSVPAGIFDLWVAWVVKRLRRARA